MTYQVGDFVRFEGEYTTGKRPLEPRNPRATVTTDHGTQELKPTRSGVGLYYVDVSLHVAGPVIVRFSGEINGTTEIYSEQTFAVQKTEMAQAAETPIPRSVATGAEAVARMSARDMMVEDLRAAGITIKASYSDGVVASAHAAMLAGRAESRRDARTRGRALESLRPLKR